MDGNGSRSFILKENSNFSENRLTKMHLTTNLVKCCNHLPWKIKHNWWPLHFQMHAKLYTCNKWVYCIHSLWTEPFWGMENTRSWADRLNNVCFALKRAAKTDLMKALSHIVLSVRLRDVPKHNGPKHNFKDLSC